MPSNSVKMTIQSNALNALFLPASRTQLKIGCSSAGGAAQPKLYASTQQLVNDFGYGPGVQAAALVLDKGGKVIFAKCAATTAGTATAVVHTGTGTSVVTVTGAPYDTYFVLVTITLGGTIAAGPISFTYSLDAGRTTSPVQSLGVAVTFAIPNTNITLNFAAGNTVAGDTFTFGTTEPKWASTDVQACINAVAAQLNTFSWDSGIHVVGKASASEAATLAGYVANLATQYFVYTRLMLETVDAVSGGNAAYGAGATTEATWMTAIQADYAATANDLLCVGAGHYNITSPVDSRQYRRPMSWVAAVRETLVLPHVHLGRVADGNLPALATAANDGFVYHDETVVPGLDGARFMALMSIPGKIGMFVKNPNMMSQLGSDFSILPYGRVMDVGCNVARLYLLNYVNDTVRLDAKTGYILERDARTIESGGTTQLQIALVAPGDASSVKMTIARNDAIQQTKILNATVRILALGYILEIDVNIGFSNPSFSVAA